ncbi:hypothetical protein ACX40Y_10330 [Sphingomonas sp. RS6]
MRLPLAPVIAVPLGALAALGVVAMPAAMLQSLVAPSGLTDLLPVLVPPLGLAGRMLLSVAAGAAVTAISGLFTYMLVGRSAIGGGHDAMPDWDADPDSLAMPVLRRADAHPDAPARPPLLATRDLGTPFAAEIAETAAIRAERFQVVSAIEAVEIDEERPLPTDLDQVLAAYDPGAIPDVPIAPPTSPYRAAAPETARPADEPLERLDRRAPAPAAPYAFPEEPIAHPATEATVHALLERLERGVSRRAAAQAKSSPATASRRPQQGLEDALATLRNLARQA